MVCSGANGLGLALVIPATQSLVADLYPPEARGRAFGFLLLFSGIGARLAFLLYYNIYINVKQCSLYRLMRPRVRLPAAVQRHMCAVGSPVRSCMSC